MLKYVPDLGSFTLTTCIMSTNNVAGFIRHKLGLS